MALETFTPGQVLTAAELTQIVKAIDSPVAESANYVAVAGDLVLMDATAGNKTVTLPAVTAGILVSIKKIDSSTNTVTISPVSGTIDGASTLVLSTQYASSRLISDGANWFVIAQTGANALTKLSGVLGGSVALPPTTVTKVMDTSSLAIGVWDLSMQCCFVPPASGVPVVALVMAVDTATATFGGPVASVMQIEVTGGFESCLNLRCIVTVTVAGTVSMSINMGAGTGNGSALATSLSLNVTGWTAIKIG